MMRTTKQRRTTHDLKFPFGNHSCRPTAQRTCPSSVHPINESAIFSFLYCHSLNLQLLMLWIVFVSGLFEHSLGETSRPLNRAAAKGGKVQLNCSTHEKGNGYWTYTKTFESNDMRIYDGYNVVNGMKSLFLVNDSVKGHFNLIFNASESTSGRYTCQPDVNSADQSAEVIVLETTPNCSMTETSDMVVNASCSIDFSGNWAPEIQWHNMNGRLETNDTTTIPNSRVSSFLIVPLNETDILTCTPTFALESKSYETTATNVPDLRINCTLTRGLPSDAVSTQPTTNTTTATTTTATTSSPLLYIIGIVVVCVLVIIFIIVLFRTRKKCTRSSGNKGATEAVLLKNATKA